MRKKYRHKYLIKKNKEEYNMPIDPTITVTSTNDSGPGSLRAAINIAAPGDAIIFSAAILPATITLTSGPIAINKTLTITGPGSNRLIISGSNNRIFIISGATTVVTITDLSIENGFNSGPGGAILNQSATLNVL
jgi:hypothetical protein